ncbi:MAG TPA: flagellar type III secretion system pore protein FliP [Acidimicrobiales bacterium]|nr:flagellar type III secretion system pore protein FliP [Acidimicrobiales bacterium]
MVPTTPARSLRRALAAVALAIALAVLPGAAPAGAQLPPGAEGVTAPVDPSTVIPQPGQPASVTVELPDVTEKPSQSVIIILALTVLSVAPALLIMMTSFTRIAIVLSLTRNALGLTTVPPNQVIVGLALFLSLFVMGPTLSEINDEAIQPLLAGDIEQGEAYDAAVTPIRTFMLGQTREEEIGMFLSFQEADRPEDPDDVGLTALIPAFILSELRIAFIIGFVIFIPFLVVDIIVSSSLMSMGMMMLPPVLVSLPFKLMLFVMIDGWDLIVRSLITSFG